MPHKEQTNRRDGAYSAWHRKESTSRYVGKEEAFGLTMIDIDATVYVEAERYSLTPIALIETAIDVGQPNKKASITQNLAQMASIEAYLVLYKPSETKRNPADTEWMDIESFRIKRLWPPPTHNEWSVVSPAWWAKFLVDLRNRNKSITFPLRQKSWQ